MPLKSPDMARAAAAAENHSQPQERPMIAAFFVPNGTAQRQPKRLGWAAPQTNRGIAGHLPRLFLGVTVGQVAMPCCSSLYRTPQEISMSLGIVA